MEEWMRLVADHMIHTVETLNLHQWWLIGLTIIQIIHLIGYAIHKHK